MQVDNNSSSMGRHYPVRENERPREWGSASPPRNRERQMSAGSEDLQMEDYYSSSEERYYLAREKEKERLRERERSSASPPRNRERHKEGSQADPLHSMSTQNLRQTDFIGKCEVLEERKTSDASSQLPEVSKSNGDMGTNSGKNRKRNRPKQPGRSDTDYGTNAVETVEDTEGTVNWRRVQVLVKVLEHAGEPINKLGMITAVHTEDVYMVKLLDNFQQIPVAGTNMMRLQLNKDDNIIVVSGPHEGKMGQLYEIIGADGCIKLKFMPDGHAIPDDIDSIDIVDIWRLCKCGSKRDERKTPTKGESEYLGSVETAELGNYLDLSHEASENEPQIHICFKAEYSSGSINGREGPDRIDAVCTFLDPLGIQFIQIYGQAHVLRLIPDSQASRLNVHSSVSLNLTVPNVDPLDVRSVHKCSEIPIHF